MSRNVEVQRPNFTPGPWSVEPCSNGGMFLRRGGWDNHVQHSLQVFPERDAVLMSAAPELLAALRNVLRWAEEERWFAAGKMGITGTIPEIEARFPPPDCFVAAREAIAKAEGR